MALGLSGTPIDNRLDDLPGQVHAIWPNRFGSWWSFTERYYNCTPGEYGGKHLGDLLEENLAELQDRIDAVSMRVTKEEVAHLLPPLRIQQIVTGKQL